MEINERVQTCWARKGLDRSINVTITIKQPTCANEKDVYIRVLGKKENRYLIRVEVNVRQFQCQSIVRFLKLWPITVFKNDKIAHKNKNP